MEFSGCYDLTSITIPSSVTSIGDDALYGCNKLTTVVVGNASPVKIGSYVFSNRENATLYVPKGSKEAYEAADYWKEFKEIVEYDTEDDYILGDVNGNDKVDIGDAVTIVNFLVGKTACLSRSIGMEEDEKEPQ
ncbi:MAG: leucine-rich repeat protein [Paludibacteraceae bacterium]|nr:leucine-rich repeat protein [Paludibacteraceae bacterium]